MKQPKFLADDMLARLARWLRAAGLDVAYAGNGESNGDILRRARRAGRIVLTRDLKFPGRPDERILIESRQLREQMVEVLRCYPLFDPLGRPFSRCMECNIPVVPVDCESENLPAGVPEGVTGPFTRCTRCGRLFWEGSHVDRVREELVAVRDRLAVAARDEAEGMPPPFSRGEYDSFLREAFALLGLSWRGYRRVRKGLRTRIRRRLAALGLRTLGEYVEILRFDPAERNRLGMILAVTISRFYRDRNVWLRFGDHLFPELEALAAMTGGEGGGEVRAWSLGCASGEEPYTLRMVWNETGRSERDLRIFASDLKEKCLERAACGIYRESGVHSVPPEILSKYFCREGLDYRLDEKILRSVSFGKFDWRSDPWPSGFHWILARNGIFTYLDEGGKRIALGQIAGALVPGGFLWTGGNETIPSRDSGSFEQVAPNLYRLATLDGLRCDP